MPKLRRYSPVTFTVMSVAFLFGCSAQRLATGGKSNGVATVHDPAFSLDTPLNHIAADQRGKAILEHDLPGLMASRSYALFDDMSLSQIAAVSGGQLTKTELDLVEADLSHLSAEKIAGQ